MFEQMSRTLLCGSWSVVHPDLIQNVQYVGIILYTYILIILERFILVNNTLHTLLYMFLFDVARCFSVSNYQFRNWETATELINMGRSTKFVFQPWKRGNFNFPGLDARCHYPIFSIFQIQYTYIIFACTSPASISKWMFRRMTCNLLVR